MGDSPPVEFCVVGLGNPGGEYERTRHNVGFQTVDRLAAKAGIDIRRPEFEALTARAMLGRSMVLLVKPQTFMNASGRSAASALQGLGLDPRSLIAVYDDLDLPLGRLRIRADGGSGGHRGVASLIDALGTSAFVRVRVGIGRPPQPRTVLEHVLSPFSESEAIEADRAVDRAADAVLGIIRDGLSVAMGAFSGR